MHNEVEDGEDVGEAGEVAASAAELLEAEVDSLAEHDQVHHLAEALAPVPVQVRLSAADNDRVHLSTVALLDQM
jgi:hypothetical protein